MNVIKLENIAMIGNEVALAWDDGGETYLNFEQLRRACPCAACQGEPDVTGKVLVPKGSSLTRALSFAGIKLLEATRCSFSGRMGIAPVFTPLIF